MTTLATKPAARQSTRHQPIGIVHVVGMPSPQEVSDALRGVRVPGNTPAVRAAMEAAYQSLAAELTALGYDRQRIAQRTYEAAGEILANARDGFLPAAPAMVLAPAPTVKAATPKPASKR